MSRWASNPRVKPLGDKAPVQLLMSSKLQIRLEGSNAIEFLSSSPSLHSG